MRGSPPREHSPRKGGSFHRINTGHRCAACSQGCQAVEGSVLKSSTGVEELVEFRTLSQGMPIITWKSRVSNFSVTE